MIELLRKYPPANRLERRTTQKYTIPGTNVTLEKDTLVFIPAFAIHRDPLLYPDPEKFDPERFNKDAQNPIRPYTYLPFGAGPRNCKNTK